MLDDTAQKPRSFPSLPVPFLPGDSTTLALLSWPLERSQAERERARHLAPSADTVVSKSILTGVSSCLDSVGCGTLVRPTTAAGPSTLRRDGMDDRLPPQHTCLHRVRPEETESAAAAVASSKLMRVSFPLSRHPPPPERGDPAVGERAGRRPTENFLSWCNLKLQSPPGLWEFGKASSGTWHGVSCKLLFRLSDGRKFL